MRTGTTTLFVLHCTDRQQGWITEQRRGTQHPQTDQSQPCLLQVNQLYPCTLFIYLGLSQDQFRKHPVCWLQTILMRAANAFQVPACFSFWSCKVLDQYWSINCTFQLIQRNGGEKWCTIHVHTPCPFKFTNKYPINTFLWARRFLCKSCNFWKKYTLRALLIQF